MLSLLVEAWFFLMTVVESNAEGAQEVDPAADAIAVAAAGAGLAAEGEVVLDDALHQVFYGPAAVEPTAQAVAALAAVAAGCADGQVMGDGAGDHVIVATPSLSTPPPSAAPPLLAGPLVSALPPWAWLWSMMQPVMVSVVADSLTMPPPPAVAAGPASPGLAANGGVVFHRAVADGDITHGEGEVDGAAAAPPPSTSPGVDVGAGTGESLAADGLVMVERAVGDRTRREGEDPPAIRRRRRTRRWAESGCLRETRL